MKLFIALIVIGSAIPAFAEDCGKDEIAKVVAKACDIVTAKKEAAFNELAAPEFNGKCGSYVWVHEYPGKEIIASFHPANPALMGKDVSGLNDTNGKPIFGTFKKAAPKKGDAAWVGYFWPKAGEEKPQAKCSFIKNCDGKYTAGMGIYGDCAKMGIKKFF